MVTDASPRLRQQVAGCLLGGAVGDALGAPVEFLSLEAIRRRFGPDGVTDFAPEHGRVGAITDDTQMTLFTAEGLLRARSRGEERGICDVGTIVRHAYLRWLETQDEESDDPAFGFATERKVRGWLVDVPALRSRRAPGNTCLSALVAGGLGRVDHPVNDSKGCGTVMRAAPAGILAESIEQAFQWGCEISAITHGHPTGWLAGGALAAVVRALLDGSDIAHAASEALQMLGTDGRSGECRGAMEAAIRAAGKGAPSAAQVAGLGKGWIAEEALAIGLYAALSCSTFRDGVLLAVNHGGDSDSTGSIAGNILGAALGREAIPDGWLSRLELREVIERVAEDLVTGYRDDEAWWKRYPGC